MTKRCETLIFDLGNVIIDLDFNRTESELSEFGLSFLHASATDHEKFLEFEIGSISENDFLDYFIQRSKHPVNTVDLVQAWTAMLSDIPPERLHMLTELKNKYQTLILSNTNCMHVRWFNDHLARHHHINSFSELVHKAYYSNEVGMRKPDPEIFKFIIQDKGLIPDNTYFFDDDPENIRSAQMLGIQSFQVLKGTSILEVVRNASGISFE